MKVVVLIPSFNPSELLIKYVEELKHIGLKDIIVVDDGSSSDIIFKKLKYVKIIHHEVNKGKGCALKTGFKYYIENYKDYIGVVTADDDGQHSALDTLNVAESLESNFNSLILGTRNFNEKQVPFRSKYGNKITTSIFKSLYKKRINDTQTGLRGLPNKLIEECIKLDGDKFDFEINVLVHSVIKNINIVEIPIKTIYINKNKGSRFKGITDSLKIYKVMFKRKRYLSIGDSSD